MNIILLHYSAPPVIGGVELVLRHQAGIMADDHQVQIMAGRGEQFDPRIPLINLPLIDSLHPAVLEVKAELDRGKLSSKFDKLTAEIEGLLSGFISGIDVVIAHNVCSLHKNLALTAALWNLAGRHDRPRFILWHHDLAWTGLRYRAELHDGYPWDLLRKAMPGALQVTISSARRQELAELLQVTKGEISVIPNGVDVEDFFKLEGQTRAFARQLGLLDAIPLLLLPVRITARKNIELALQILARLRADFPAAKLVVTGPLGPHNPSNAEYFERLKSIRSQLGLIDSAHFLAELSREYIPDAVISDLYQLADAVIFPSREEGFGIPILEAGLAGLPVFCSDISTLRELGGSHVEYFSTEADPASVASLMRDHFNSSLIFGLRSQVRSSYQWESVYAQKIAPLLNSLQW